MLNRRRPSLIIPVEEQVREFDAKLLLAFKAVIRGYHVYIGRRDKIELGLSRFNPGIYLAMDIRTPRIFAFAKKLGYHVVVMDEEAVVHYPDFIYTKRRVVDESLNYISAFLAWGDDNVQLWTGIPKIGRNYDIFLTGNPRADLLRPELRAFFKAQADLIKKNYGRYILINTNFGLVINKNPVLNLYYHDPENPDALKHGKTSVGMPVEYATGLWNHKRKLYEAFLQMVPELAGEFPKELIVLRPHPMEKHDAYLALADKYPNVKVIHEGNVIPWLMNAKVLVHNGCTTGLEAYLLDRPVIAYQPEIDKSFDNELPNSLSYCSFNLSSLVSKINTILNGSEASAHDEDLEKIATHHVCSQTGRLAADRMVDCFDDILSHSHNRAPLLDRIYAKILMKRWAKQKISRSSSNIKTINSRFSRIEIDEIERRLEDLKALLGEQNKIAIHKIDDNLFKLNASYPQKDSRPIKVYHRKTYHADKFEYPIKRLFTHPIKQQRLTGYLVNRVIGFDSFIVEKKELADLFQADAPRTAGKVNSWQASKPVKFKTAHIAEVSNGYANLFGQVFTEDAQLIHGCTHKLYFKGKYPTWRSRFKKKRPSLLKPVISYYRDPVSVVTASTQNYYYHWLFDVLPRLELLKMTMNGFSDLIYVTLLKKYQSESFRLLDFKGTQIINPVTEPFIRSKKLVVPCHQVIPGHEVPQWVVQFLRKTFFQLTQQNCSPSKRRIYISRAGASHRRVLNEEELVSSLSKYGFEMLKLEELSLKQQVSAFRDAEIIIAPHGGGLANLAFSSQGTKVIELFPKINVDLYYRISKAAGLDYYYVKSRYGYPKILDLNDYFISDDDIVNTLKLSGVSV
jgi:surface carbohydrate biosynthesis protein